MISNAYQWILHQGKSSWNVKLIIHLQLTFSLKTHAALLFCLTYLYGVVFKHRDNLTFTFQKLTNPCPNSPNPGASLRSFSRVFAKVM